MKCLSLTLLPPEGTRTEAGTREDGNSPLSAATHAQGQLIPRSDGKDSWLLLGSTSDTSGLPE